ncbi:ribose 5-phosphate isomerase B [Bryobacterales bacterium F-183]|nr:ribose 5-phosphate isomerase B [Bryobacterales bacterium F-183]
MRIAIGADHAGLVLKDELRDHLIAQGHDVVDLGTNSPDSTDYPDYASAVAHKVSAGDAERGILVCSTGVGMSMAANKVRGVRAALAFNTDEIQLTREHNDANVLAIGAKYVTTAEAQQFLDVFLKTPFSNGERHARRIAKLADLEEKQDLTS